MPLDNTTIVEPTAPTAPPSRAEISATVLQQMFGNLLNQIADLEISLALARNDLIIARQLIDTLESQLATPPTD